MLLYFDTLCVKFYEDIDYGILSGGIIPLFLLPGFLEEILNMLPFAGMVYIPINLYLGKISCFEGMKFIFIEIIWIIIFALINSMLFHHVIKKVVVQGG